MAAVAQAGEDHEHRRLVLLERRTEVVGALLPTLFTVRRPRVRGLTERFESRLLPLFNLHGLAEGGLRYSPCAGSWARGRPCR